MPACSDLCSSFLCVRVWISSLRAQFVGASERVNQLHGSASSEEAEKEIGFFFPKEQTLAVIKPDTAEEHRGTVASHVRGVYNDFLHCTSYYCTGVTVSPNLLQQPMVYLVLVFSFCSAKTHQKRSAGSNILALLVRQFNLTLNQLERQLKNYV